MLKPQDVLVTLKLLALPPETVPTYPELAADLCMSVSETHAAVRRACRSRLLLSEVGKAASLRFVRPCLPALAEFLCGGLRYVFPAEVDGTAVGMPTASAAAPLAEVLTSDNSPPVWPLRNGGVPGVAIEPLYPSAPLAAQKDAVLYEWLALTDALRLGQGRTAGLAKEMIRQRLSRHRHHAFAS